MDHLGLTIRLLLAFSICSYFVVIPAVILDKMMRINSSQWWRFWVGSAAICGVGISMTFQGLLCGSPLKAPNVMSAMGNTYMALLLIDGILLFGTYWVYYLKNKKLNSADK